MSLSQLVVFPLDHALHFSALLLHVLYFLYPILVIVYKKQWRPKNYTHPHPHPHMCGCVCVCIYTGIHHFIVFCFIAVYRYYVFSKLKVCGNPASTKSIGAIFPTGFAPFVSVSCFGNSHNISNCFMIIIFVMMICDQQSLMLLLQLTEGSDDGYLFLAMKYFLIKICTFLKRHNATAHLIDYSIV